MSVEAAVLPEVERLVLALEELGNSLLACRAAGLEPADAFRAAGIEIPMLAAPMLNMMFRGDDAALT